MKEKGEEAKENLAARSDSDGQSAANLTECRLLEPIYGDKGACV
jgi:hypothetical protein